MRHICLSFLFVVAALLCGCEKKNDVPEPTPTPSDVDTSEVRTVLVYIVSENSLGSSDYIGADIEEMLEGVKKSVNMTKNDHLLLYVDDTKLPRFYDLTIAEKESDNKSISTVVPVYQFDEDVCSADPEQLKVVMDYMIEHYPADSYGAVFASHASGWIGTWDVQEAKARKTFGLDNGKNTLNDFGTEMEIADMAEVLSHYPKFDFMFFDACFMQCIEVDYALRNCADYIIASPAEIPAYGGYYTDLVDLMFVGGAEGSKAIADSYISYYSLNTYYGGALLSVVNTSEMESFADYMKQVVDKHREGLLAVEAQYEDMDYYCYDDYYIKEYPDYYDIQFLMNKVLTDAEMSDYKKAVDKAIIHKACNKYWVTVFGYSNERDVVESQYGGASMFIPQEKYAKDYYDYLSQYPHTEWGKKVWGY